MNIVPKVRGASRTDVGVHALCNAFTFDAVDSEIRKDYEPDRLRRGLNNYFNINQEQIQINDLYKTKDPWFDCRGAPSQRTYIYKILLTKEGVNQKSQLSLFNRESAWELDWNTIDLDKFHEATQLFVGHHCFKHFVKINKDEPDPKGYMRTIDSVKVNLVQPELMSFSNSKTQMYLMTEIKSKAFLWHQIRIMMMNIVLYAQSIMSKEQITELLTGDDDIYALKYQWRDKIQAPPQGLYLADIKYDLENFIVTNV